ncbi:glycosyl transferase [Kosmotoga arenicorallina S304]|uniref:Glycosyl transferase n=1 Tax=Kosmotoga arenicorallina S304 TaxID=1453497 RepID=A0A176JTI9_9BACT|nr:glycosyltransferase family 2 protein [Kosmotoga arenicorallina]OAA26589.1 glycosyl transferase [Kosmotoga arenicorallina S304]
MPDSAFVSVIIPARNEEKFIARCLESFLKQDYPQHLIEIVIVDGMSEDNTEKIVSKFISKHPNIKLLKNEKRITPVALNIGIKNAKGDYILFSGAHSEIPPDYVSRCVKYLEEYEADNVGGVVITKPRENTTKGKVIVELLSHPFGVGGSKFRTGVNKPTNVDTVPFGCYRREAFEKIGLFNEHLIRNQDIELNLRLKRAGGKIMLFPDISLTYYARSTFKELWKNNFGNGFWVVYADKFSKLPFSLRHLVPFFFVLFLSIGSILSFFSFYTREVFLAILSLYMILDFVFSLSIAKKLKSLKAFFLSFFGFLSLHVSYGLGSVVGFLFVLFSGGKKR